MRYLLAFSILLSASQVQAQAWPSGARPTADWISTGLVGLNVGMDGYESYKHHCLKSFGLRTGLTVAVAEVTKRLVHRTRPDGSDRMSFFSEHTAIAVSSAGWNFAIGVPISFGAGYLRIGANKHYDTDVLAGAGMGLLSSHLFSCGESR